MSRFGEKNRLLGYRASLVVYCLVIEPVKIRPRALTSHHISLIRQTDREAKL